MDVLASAALSWARKSDTVGDVDSACNSARNSADPELMYAYASRLANSKTNPPDHLQDTFAGLVSHFGVSAPESPVLQIVDSCIRFRPLLVRPGEHLAAQASCFATLMNYWKATPEPIELLAIELKEASKTRIRECMKDVSASDVVRGIQIWETLPCRIQKVVVYEPTGMPMLIWAMQTSMRLCLPKKVLSKIRFSRKSYGDPSKERNAHANGDGTVGAVDDSEDADASGAQEALKGLVEAEVVTDQTCDALLCEAYAAHGDESAVVAAQNHARVHS